MKAHHSFPGLPKQSKAKRAAVALLAFYLPTAIVVLYASSSRADLQREYSNNKNQQFNQSSQDQCERRKRQGNYTKEGAGNWSPEIFLDGDIVYLSLPQGPCNFEWQKVGVIGKQSEINGNTYLFTKKKSDLVLLEKRKCLNNCDNLPPIQKSCYVPIDWSKGERKYPYCGCFDSSVRSLMSSPGYCNNNAGFSFNRFLKNLLKPFE